MMQTTRSWISSSVRSLLSVLSDDNFAELSDELAEKYTALFGTPEAFLRSGDRILVFPMGPDPDACSF